MCDIEKALEVRTYNPMYGTKGIPTIADEMNSYDSLFTRNLIEYERI